MIGGVFLWACRKGSVYRTYRCVPSPQGTQACVHARDLMNNVPLHAAAFSGNLGIVSRLLMANAEADAKVSSHCCRHMRRRLWRRPRVSAGGDKAS